MEKILAGNNRSKKISLFLTALVPLVSAHGSAREQRK